MQVCICNKTNHDSLGIRDWIGRAVACVIAMATAIGASAADGDFAWAGAFGGLSAVQNQAVDTDAAGNVYIAGRYDDTADFDPGAGTANRTAVGGGDVHIVKLDAGGALVWAQSIGGASSDSVSSLAVGDDGSVYIGGEFEGTCDFDPGAGTAELTAQGSSDGYILKLDSDGQFVWVRSFRGNSAVSVADLAIAPNGRVVSTGIFADTVDFDPSANELELTSAGDNDIFVVSLDEDGVLAWARAMGGASLCAGEGVAVDSAGNVFVAGSYQGTSEFDPGAGSFALTANGTRDGFLLKLDSAGSFSWVLGIGGTSVDDAFAVTTDAAGNAYVTGSFRSTVDFNPSGGAVELTSTGGADVFVAKYGAGGASVWVSAFSGLSNAFGKGIAIDASGSVVTTGDFFGTQDFDPGAGNVPLTPVGNSDAFLSKLDANGDFVWAKGIGGATSEFGLAVAVDSVGDVVSVGQFSTTVDFDPGPGTNNISVVGDYDGFVLKLEGSGLSLPNAVTITPSATGPTSATSMDFTVEFDTDVYNFDDDDAVVISHSGTSNTGISISGGPQLYTVTVEGLSGDGSFTLAANTNTGATDLAGNALASSVTSDPVVIDNTPPGTPAITTNGGADFTTGVALVTLEGTTDPDTEVLRLDGDPIAGYTAGDTAWSVEVDLLAKSVNTYAFTAEDAAGNESAASSITITYDESFGTSAVPLAAWPAAVALSALALASVTLRRRGLAEEK